MQYDIRVKVTDDTIEFVGAREFKGSEAELAFMLSETIKAMFADSGDAFDRAKILAETLILVYAGDDWQSWGEIETERKALLESSEAFLSSLATL
jgi:hypothetical protein